MNSHKDDDDELASQLNQSLNDVLDLLAREVERLKVDLEYYRIGDHPQKNELIRQCVVEIDLRQDRMEEIKSQILARGDLLH